MAVSSTSNATEISLLLLHNSALGPPLLPPGVKPCCTPALSIEETRRRALLSRSNTPAAPANALHCGCRHVQLSTSHRGGGGGGGTGCEGEILSLP